MAARKAFPLRINPRLYETLRKWSDDELRSVNGQIEYLLLEAAKRSGRWKPSVEARPSSPKSARVGGNRGTETR